MFKKFLKKMFGGKAKKSVAYRAQEIWWAQTGESESPVLVFRKLNGDMLWALPLTARAAGKNQPLYFLSSLKGKNQAALSRMRVLRSHQLLRRLSKISDRQFGALNAAVLQSLSETDPLRRIRAVSPRTRTKPFAPLSRPRLSPIQLTPALSLR
jgi:hypothetical protein